MQNKSMMSESIITHGDLAGRDLPEQHPISAITGLRDSLSTARADVSSVEGYLDFMKKASQSAQEYANISAQYASYIEKLKLDFTKMSSDVHEYYALCLKLAEESQAALAMIETTKNSVEAYAGQAKESADEARTIEASVKALWEKMADLRQMAETANRYHDEILAAAKNTADSAASAYSYAQASASYAQQAPQNAARVAAMVRFRTH